MSNASEQLVVTCGCEKQVKMRVPASGMGKVFKCVQCGQRVHVNEHNTQPMDSPAAQDQPKSSPAEPIGALLTEKGLITEEQLEEALAEQKREGGKTFEILIRLGYLDKEALHGVLSRQPGVATIELEHMKVDQELVDLIPEELATSCLVLPIDKLGRLLSVAMACPLDVATITRLEEHTGLKVKAMLCRYDAMVEAVEKFYAPRDEQEAEDYFQMPAGLGGSSSSGLMARIDTLSLFPVPATAAESVASHAQGGTAHAKELVKVMGRFPTLAANALLLANSRAYGMAGKVDSVALAVSLLGPQGALQAIAETKPDDPEALKERAERTALIAALLARQTNKAQRGQAFAAGLLIDLGRWACLALDADRFKQLDDHLKGPDRLEDERQKLGESGPVLAGELAREWSLPEVLQGALEHWVSPKNASNEAKGLAAILNVASIAGADGLGPDACSTETFTILGLKPADVTTLVQKALKR